MVENNLNILVIPCTEWLKGPQQRLHHLSKEWSKRNSVYVFYLQRGDMIVSNHIFHERLQYSKMVRIPTIILRNYPLFLISNFIFELIYLPKIIKELNIDVIVAEGLGPSNVAAVASKLLKRPIIFDYSDSYSSFVSAYIQNSFLKKLIEAIATILTNVNVSLSDFTVVVSNGLLSLKHLEKERKIVNGVSQEYFPISNRKEFCDNTVVITFVGALESWVNFDKVLDAMKELNCEGGKRYILMIIGAGSTLQKLKDGISSRGLDKLVILTGWVPYAHLHEYLAKSDICILPFDDSQISNLSMPMKIHEYAMSKKPIITSPIPEVKKIYGSSVIYANDLHGYIQGIKLLTENALLRSQLVEQAYDIAKCYSWAKLAQEYEGLMK